MNNSSKHPRIAFFCQMAGPLFRELAQDIADKWPPCILFTGHPDTIERGSQIGSLYIKAGPMYRRTSNLSRLLSGLHFMFCAGFQCWRLPENSLLFLMATPLCLGIIGYLFKRSRGQRYVMLVYDIYPDTLVNLGRLKESGWITRLWRRINRLAWENAEIVFTIGDRMAENLERKFDVTKTAPGRVIPIYNWANTEWIRPVAKADNEFAKKYGQVGKLTVMYSGNLGHTHDIETILAAAKELREHDSIHFMIIGEGAKRKIVEESKREDDLENLTILPLQPESLLPVTLPTADISVITLDKGSEGLSVPSKTHYYMAAGSALIGLCDNDSEVAQIIDRHKCGILVSPGDIDTFVSEVLSLSKDKTKLNYYQANSRRAAEDFYSRKNTDRYLEALSAVGSLQKSQLSPSG